MEGVADRHSLAQHRTGAEQGRWAPAARLRFLQARWRARRAGLALSPSALRAVVEEFVTRDGTDDSSIERCIKTVIRQLDAGRVELYFDGKTETCNILPMEEKPPARDGDE
jgi:hypothetical protein